ncbi:17032_t:CDS:2, partial [Dentiscutata heterogama]
IQEGSMNTRDYDGFIEHVLLLVLDNAIIYKSTHLEDICREKEVKLVFLPAYSPDFNPQNKIWAESMPDPLEVLDLT